MKQLSTQLRRLRRVRDVDHLAGIRDETFQEHDYPIVNFTLSTKANRHCIARAAKAAGFTAKHTRSVVDGKYTGTTVDEVPRSSLDICFTPIGTRSKPLWAVDITLRNLKGKLKEAKRQKIIKLIKNVKPAEVKRKK